MFSHKEKLKIIEFWILHKSYMKLQGAWNKEYGLRGRRVAKLPIRNNIKALIDKWQRTD